MSAAVHYPETRNVVGDGTVGAQYVAACSCGWRADVRHTRRRDAIPAAIAHARDLNHPTPGGPK